jgi:IclR family acetate operon transcriptional repressor
MAEQGKITTTTVPRRRRPRWAVEDGVREKEAIAPEDRYHSRTIERALDALESFESSSTALSLKQISAITGQPEASLYRVLITLQKREYLSQNADGTYQLTRKVLYGRVLDKAETLRRLARPVLENLARKFDETASLSYFFKHYIQVLDTVETFHTFRISNRAGRILPPHCSAMGKSILAYQTDDAGDALVEAYGLVRRTEHSICDRQDLRAEMAEVRAKGWACDREESVVGGICFGAPIFDPAGNAIAALSVSTPVQRMHQEREKQVREAVQEAAAGITDTLGGHAPRSKST